MSDLLLAYGLDDRVSALFNTLEAPPGHELILGRVVRVERTNCLVATSGAVLLARAAQTLGIQTATGDWVAMVHEPGNDLAIVEVLPRRSELVRRAPEDRGGGAQVLAANIDILALTAPFDRPTSINRLERLLVLAWESGARPLVVLTKADLLGPDASSVDHEVAEAERAAIGVDVLATSAETGLGVAALRTLAAGGTLAFIGPSGSGKSTLVNALIGSHVQKTGAVRGADSRGKHTTTSRDLIPLPGGGVLLDTPGLRSLGLLDPEAGLASTFADIGELAQMCQFSNCAHTSEPGCAVLESIRAGDLTARRLENYRKIQRELLHERRRQSGLDAVAARREFRAQHERLLRAAGPARLDERRQGWR